MKFTYANGWRNPRFSVYNKNKNLICECTFRELNDGGMLENHEEVTIQREDLNRTLKEYFLGYRLHFTLHYNQFINLDTLLRFKTVVDYQHSKDESSPYKIYLTPNEDNLTRRFEVIFSNENIELGIIRSGERVYGNRGVIFKLQSVELVKSFDVSDPANIPYTYLNNHYII
ncbi:MAG: hypothetical protein JSS63_02395 [Bacteroidetes bacterium]|nr:hypothetical protein [Bacteroidota bacterium]